MLLATFFLSLQALFVKLASADLTIPFLAFARCFMNFLVFFAWHAFQHRKVRWRFLFATKQWKLHAIRSLFGVGAIYCFYYSVELLSLSVATVVMFSFPILVPIVARLWLNIHFLPRLLWGLLIAFIGLITILQPDGNLLHPWSLIPLLGAVLLAVAIIAIRRLHKTEPSERILCYFFVAGALVTSIVWLFSPEEGPHIFSASALSMAFFIGIFSVLFQTLLTLAMKHSPARFVSPLIYLSFFFNAIFDLWIFQAPFHLGIVLGFLLIATGSILVLACYPKSLR